MDLFPAIDVRGGRCVRLRQGDYGAETVYGDDPVAVATTFAQAGARWIHTVDLDAARTGIASNRAVIEAIAAAVAPLGVRVQSGGGVRTLAAAQALFDAGVARVVIGTKAVEDPGLVFAVAEAGAARGSAVAIGLDTNTVDGRREVATHGWTAGSGVLLDDALVSLAEAGAAAVIVTDIGRDGMLTGPDLDGLRDVLDMVGSFARPIDVIASGGISSLEDLEAIAALCCDPRSASQGVRTGIAGAITGKAIYEGRFTVAEAVRRCGS